jgi:hypothetical protein
MGSFAAGSRWTLLAGAVVAFVLRAGLGFAIIPPLIDDEKIDIYTRVFFYDKEGSGGLTFPNLGGHYWYEHYLPGASMEFFFNPESKVPDVTLPDYLRAWLSYSPGGSPIMAGQEIRFLARVPRLGVFEGRAPASARYGYVGSTVKYPPHYFIPTTSSKVGLDLVVPGKKAYLSDDRNNGEFVLFAVYPFISQNKSLPGSMVSMAAFQNLIGTNITVRVDYLKGCSFYPRQSDVRTIPASYYYQSLIYVVREYMFIKWSGYQENRGDTIYLDRIAPRGPVRVSLGLEGYTTDTITINCENIRRYDWYPLLEPLPPPHGGESAGGITFARVEEPFDTPSPTPTPTPSPTLPPPSPTPSPSPSPTDSGSVIPYILGSGEVALPADENGDGVIDITDLLNYWFKKP